MYALTSKLLIIPSRSSQLSTSEVMRCACSINDSIRNMQLSIFSWSNGFCRNLLCISWNLWTRDLTNESMSITLDRILCVMIIMYLRYLNAVYVTLSCSVEQGKGVLVNLWLWDHLIQYFTQIIILLNTNMFFKKMLLKSVPKCMSF